MKTMPNIEKKIEQMDEYGDEIDFEDDDDEEIPDIGELLMEKYFSMSLAFFQKKTTTKTAKKMIPMTLVMLANC